MEFNLKKYFLLLLASSVMGSSLPAPKITQRKPNRMGRPSRAQGKKPTSIKKNKKISIKRQSSTTLENIKKFITLDYLRHCDCPNHRKNQTLKNQIRRHPERAGTYLAVGLAAGAALLWGGYKFFSFTPSHATDQPPTPPAPPMPSPVPENPEHPPVNMQPVEIEMIEIESPHEQLAQEIQINPQPAPLVQAPPLVLEESIDQNTYELIIPAFNPPAPVVHIQNSNVPQPHNLEHITRLLGQPRRIKPCAIPGNIRTINKPKAYNIEQCTRIFEQPKIINLSQSKKEPVVVGIPFNNNNAPINEDQNANNNLLEQDWVELENSFIEADKTPGFSELLTRENYNKLYEVGQIASGKLEPIINFMQKNMPQTSKTVLAKINALFANVILDIERDHVPTSIPVESEAIKIRFRTFQKNISQEIWRRIANSFDASEINSFKALFWLQAEHHLAHQISNTKDPKAKNVLIQLMPLAREMAQEILAPEVPSQAKVKIRRMGSISTQEHDWIAKRLPKVLEAQKKILNHELKCRFNDEIEKPLNIGICLSGGGYRAMTLSAGFLTALHKLGIVDSALHVSGLSGSTWFLMRWLLSNPSPEVCKDELKKVIPRANLLHLFANQDKLDMPRLVHDSILPKVIFEKPISSIDLFGGLLARALLQDCTGDNRHKLSMTDIAKRIDSADYPFPICTAISETNLSTNEQKWYNWYEYNAFEVENDTLGLCIPVHAYGNKFRDGSTLKLSQPESLGSIMATCGSAYTIDFGNQIDKAKINGTKAYVAKQAVQSVLPKGVYKNGRISPAQIHNPWHQLPAKQITERFESPEHATAITQPELCTFVDAGIDFNLPLIPLLKRARNLDVIIVGDASGSSNPMQEKNMPDGKTPCPKELAKFFQKVEPYGILYERKKTDKHSLNFSIYVPCNPKNRHEPVWIEGEKLPIIIYFNYINDPEMIERGMHDKELKALIEDNNLEQFDAQACLKNYGNTFKFEYSSDDFKQLAGIGEFNILSHKQEIIKTLADAYRRSQEFEK